MKAREAPKVHRVHPGPKVLLALPGIQIRPRPPLL